MILDSLLIRKKSHEFLDYVIKKRIADKITEKKMKKFHITKEGEIKEYQRFLRKEFNEWAKKNNIGEKYLDFVWEHYLQD